MNQKQGILPKGPEKRKALLPVRKKGFVVEFKVFS
jgi:hypothetical protein